MRTIIGLLVICTLSLLSCERSVEKAVPANADDLVGTWKLVEPSYKGEVTLKLTLLPPIPTVFTAASLYEAIGQGPVNTYFTKLMVPQKAPANQMEVESIGTTEIAGPTEAMQFEQMYYVNLKNVNRYELTDQGRLRLYYAGSQSGELVYEKTK